jgi:hypothetical protein
MIRLFAALVALCAITTGCTGSAYMMASVEVDGSRYEVVGPGEMDATGLQVLGVIPIQNTNKIERAAQRILDDNQGDELINISITESWWWGYVLNGYKVHIEGTVLRKK